MAGSSGFVRAVGVLLVAAGLALALLRYVGGSPAERGVEGALGSLALGAPVAVTGVLALLALRDRPVLLLPAAIALVPLSFLSFAGVTLPLLIPAVMLVLAYGRRSARRRPPRGTTIGSVVAIFALLFAAVVVLFLREDLRTYSTATSSGSISDTISIAESLPSLALSAAAVVAGWLLADPRS